MHQRECDATVLPVGVLAAEKAMGMYLRHHWYVLEMMSLFSSFLPELLHPEGGTGYGLYRAQQCNAAMKMRRRRKA